MTSLVGCAGDDFAMILKSLGYSAERRAGPAITVPLVTPPRAIEQPPAGQGTETGVSAELVEPQPESAEGSSAAESVVEAPSEAVEQAPEATAFTPPEADQVSAQPISDAVESVEAAREHAAETPAEPVLIEVWRQHRRHEGAQARPARGRPERGDRRPRHGEASKPQARSGETPAGERPAGERPAGDRLPRRDRRPDHRTERRDAQGEGPRPQSRPPRGPGKPDDRRGARPEKRFDNRRENPPERREKLPDPDSPFAKLLALKAQLEDGKK
jgi:ATP-dependent RNA helicase SUPV3L1/SUV3